MPHTCRCCACICTITPAWQGACADAYAECNASRMDRTQQALTLLGVSIMAGANTTNLAGVWLWLGTMVLQQVCLPHQHDYLQQRAVVPGFLPVRTTAHAFLSLHRSACKVFTMKAASYAHAMRVVNCKPSRRRLHHMRMPCEW
jgi:hypothetical protein